MRKSILFMLLFIFSSVISAQETYSVAPYSFGLSLGGQAALTEDLKIEEDSKLLTFAVNNLWLLNKNAGVTLDLEWYSLANAALFSGIDFYIGSKQFKPFVGGAVGIAYMEHDGTFNTGGGLALKAQVGCQMNLTRNFGMKIKVPYRIIFNEPKDQMIGGELSFIWYGKFKNIETIM